MYYEYLNPKWLSVCLKFPMNKLQWIRFWFKQPFKQKHWSRERRKERRISAAGDIYSLPAIPRRPTVCWKNYIVWAVEFLETLIMKKRKEMKLLARPKGIKTCHKAVTWLIWKVRSIAPSGVQKLFCTISGSRDINKTMWGIRFQEFQELGDHPWA